MSDSQRRQLCRISFLLFAVMPTVAVAAWIVWPRGGKIDPAIVGYAIGWQIEVADTRTISSTETIWRRVSFSDKTLGGMGEIGQLELELADRRLNLLADHLILNDQASATFFQDIVDRLMLRQSMPLDTVHLRINRFTLERRSIGKDGAIENHPMQTFEDVAIDFESANGQTELSVQMRPSGTDSDAVLELTLQRRIPLDASPSTTTWSLTTGSETIACHHAATWLPFLDMLGESATFRGTVHGVWDAQTWSAELHGEFKEIDLYELVSVPLHHTLHGERAIARFDTLKLEQGRIVDMNGLLYCPHGQISRTLVDAAMLHLGWTQYQPPNSWPTRFQDLFVLFATSETADRLEVRGGHAQGVLAMSPAGDPWLMESPNPVVPTSALVALLVPPSSAEVPLSRETAPLANLLPLPSQKTLVPSPTGTQRLRLDDE